MAEEFVSVIKIETGDSEQTVKGLKKQISDLRDEILNLEKGTEQYDDAVDALQSSQRKLDEVMSLTKRTATALDGSYDALTHKMAQLKKEWKATNDEARRAELGQQIAEINSQLKDFDASLGNFQRNVGNYQSALDGMENKTEDFAASMRNMQETIEPTKAKFESVQKIASGVASGFAAVQGAAALLGVENENLEQTFIKLQAAMALAQGIGGLGDLVEGIGKAKVAFAGLGDKVKAVSKVMGKGGWIGIIIAAVAAITALVVKLTNTRKEIESGAAALKEYNKTARESVGAYAEQIAEIKVLEAVTTDVNRAESERNEAGKLLLERLGEEATATNLLAVKNGEYADTIRTKVIPALVAQAKMEGALELIKEKQKAILEQQEVINQRAAEGPNGWDKTWAFLANGAMNAEPMAPRIEVDAEDYQAEGVKREQKKLDQLQKDLDLFIQQLGSYDWSDLKGLFTDEPEKTITKKAMTVAEALELAQKEIMKTLEEDIANMPELEFEMPEIKLEDVEGKSKKKADILIGYAERTAQRMRDLNSISNADEETKAQRDYEINLKLQEDKLALLKRFYEEAGKNGDIESWLELQQDIADQEVAIQQTKYEEIQRISQKSQDSVSQIGLTFKEQVKQFSDDWDKMALPEKISSIGNAVSQSFTAAADITNALGDLVEQKANENGEVSEEEAKKIKGLRIATATMDMLSGIIGAISSAAGMGPVGWVLGAIQAASIATVGGINIAKIKNTDFTGNSSTGSPSVTPSTSTYASELPATFTRQITGASEVESLNQDTRVYILESDIQASNKRVQVRESESSF